MGFISWKQRLINSYYFTVSMDQECHRSLAKCLWLRVFHEILVRKLIGSEIIWRSNWGCSIYFWYGSLPRWQLAGSLIYPSHKPLHNFCFILTTWELPSSRTKDPRESKTEITLFCELALKDKHCHFQLLKRGISKNLWT